MINFLHTFNPNPILISIGFITIYYYGLFIVLGILSGTFIAIKLSKYYNIKKQDIIDSAFWAIISGIIGARIYHIFLELPYYLEHPLNIFKIWQGGIAIHGGIIGGLIALFIFTKKKKINFLNLIGIYAPALAFAQTIGRWGNYFNQELFGKPTNLPWGIPILPENKIAEYYNFQYFHPTFLYESIGNLIIFIILISIHYLIIKKKIKNNHLPIFIYLIAYSVLRFLTEYIRIDKTPKLLGMRLPQIVSIIIVVLITFIYAKNNYFRKPSREKIG